MSNHIYPTPHTTIELAVQLAKRLSDIQFTVNTCQQNIEECTDNLLQQEFYRVMKQSYEAQTTIIKQAIAKLLEKELNIGPADSTTASN